MRATKTAVDGLVVTGELEFVDSQAVLELVYSFRIHVVVSASQEQVHLTTDSLGDSKVLELPGVVPLQSVEGFPAVDHLHLPTDFFESDASEELVLTVCPLKADDPLVTSRDFEVAGNCHLEWTFVKNGAIDFLARNALPGDGIRSSGVEESQERSAFPLQETKEEQCRTTWNVNRSFPFLQHVGFDLSNLRSLFIFFSDSISLLVMISFEIEIQLVPSNIVLNISSVVLDVIRTDPHVKVAVLMTTEIAGPPR